MPRNAVFPRALQYLIAIQDYGTYTRAAEALHVSQPTLSQQIKQLEENLKTMLVDRSGRSIRLTDAGEIYLRHARRAWWELEAGTRAIHDVQDLSRGSLRLGWTPITDHLTCSLLAKFNSSYPGITVSTLEMSQDDIESAVTEDAIDIGILFSKPIAESERTSDLESFELFEESLYFAFGKSHPRATKKLQHINPQEFSQEPVILLNTQFALRRHVDLYCRECGISPLISMETNSLSVIIEIIQLGPLGTILPGRVVKDNHGLKAIEIVPNLHNHAVSLVWHKGRYKNPACRAFIEMSSDWSARMLQETHFNQTH